MPQSTKPNQNYNLTELKDYIRMHKLNKPTCEHPILLKFKKAEIIEGLKKINRWEEIKYESTDDEEDEVKEDEVKEDEVKEDEDKEVKEDEVKEDKEDEDEVKEDEVQKWSKIDHDNIELKNFKLIFGKEIEELKKENELVKEASYHYKKDFGKDCYEVIEDFCNQLEEATCTEIHNPTKYYRGIDAVKELKKENEELKKEIAELKDDLAKEVCSSIKKSKENEELKKENEELKKAIGDHIREESDIQDYWNIMKTVK
tara:strand:- start:135 stop:908 length:774 start_codon:yes stop_codon:yes gene_type:complete